MTGQRTRQSNPSTALTSMRGWRRSHGLLFTVLAMLAALMAGCAGSSAFRLTSEDNNPALVKQALALRNQPKAGAPVNALNKPLAFLIARANKKKNIRQALIAFDLQDKRELWRLDTEVKSRVVVGSEFIAHMDGAGNLVGRALATGNQLWSIALGNDFLGAAADQERVFYVVQDKRGSKPVWWLVAVDGKTGAELWRLDAPGQLGAPAAQGGLVYSPFLKQWLSIVDARTGKQLARIRGVDEEIAFVRTTSNAVYFGSKSGVFLLDERAASGQRAQSTYGQATVPKEFSRSLYHWDAFDPVQAGYSAYDRNRLLWRGQAQDGALGFADNQIVLLIYRFFFAFDPATGALRWAYNHPRTDVVGAAHTGPSLAFASGLGELGALEPATGRRVYAAKIADQLIGATFDADGWQPAEEGEPTSTVTALASIARDRDARFGEVKRFAIAALAALPGADVTRDLIELIQNQRTPPRLYEKAVEVLTSRTEPEGLEYLLEALRVPYDYIAGTKPRAVGVLARAVAVIGTGDKLDPARRGAAIETLLGQLGAADTPASELADVIKALGAMGRGAEIAPLRSFLLAYRADPAFAGQVAPLGAAIDVLLTSGTVAERELVGFVAEDARTVPSIAEYARRALIQTEEQRAAPVQPSTPAAAPAGAAPAAAAPVPAPPATP